MTEDGRLLSNGVSRRNFVGSLAGLLAAATYSMDVPEAVSGQVTQGDDSDQQTVASPDGSIQVTVDVSTGVPTYSVSFNGTTYIDVSPIGFEFEGQQAFGTAISGSGPDLTVTGTQRATETEQWEPEWGAYDTVSAEYNDLLVGLEETTDSKRSANLQIRVFDDGFGFRIIFDQEFGEFVITSENTEFNFSQDYTTWWVENTFINPRFEHEYTRTKLSEIPAGTKTIEVPDNDSPDGTYSPNGNSRRAGAHTPLTMRASDGTVLSVHESDLEAYATMSLAAQSDSGGTKMAAELAPLPDGTKVKETAPHMTPWRTVQLGRQPGDLIESQLVPLLASERDDSVLPDGANGVDTSWISPRKYIGIWWTMIAGSAKWQYRSDDQIRAELDQITNVDKVEQYIHGARTERMKRYMQFASQNSIDSVLVEGWNKGWDSYGSNPEDTGETLEMGVADSYPDFDVPTVTSYGSSLTNPVEMTIHNETSGNILNYEDEIRNKDIFDEYESQGIRSIKNGYVSDPGLFADESRDGPSHNQHCQRAVEHHRTVMRYAAGSRQLLEIHEGIKPTGEIRTYPNVFCREVVRAQEYDGFDALNTNVGRDHHVNLPFTRMLAGPTSYQPGIFDITFNDSEGNQIQSTRAKQLAMYPCYLSGLQMAADRIEAYVDPSLEVGQFVQAQAGDLDGMITADTWRNAFGAHYVPIDPNRVDAGSSVEFIVKNVDTAGTYDLHLRYASDSEENRQAVIDNGNPEATLVVNGTEQTVQPSFTDYWDQWEIHTVSVELQAGENTIAIRLGSDDVGGFNLNTVGVSQPGEDSPVPADYSNVNPQNENYDTVPEFEFIERVPADWDETRVVDAAIGEYLILARRAGNEWYLGAMTDEDPRDLSIPLEFLSEQPDGWAVTHYGDAEGTDADKNPTAVDISEYIVAAGEKLSVSMGASGGVAMRIRPAESSGVSAGAFEDRTGDDDGPGAYTYPEDSSFENSAFDLTSFEVRETSSSYEFTFEVANLTDTFDSGSFSPQYFVVWLRDPSLAGGSTTERGDLNVTTAFESAWNYRVAASGFEQTLVDAAGNNLGSPELTVDRSANTVSLAVDRSTLSDVDISAAEVVPVVGSEDYGEFRNVEIDRTQWQFGGAKASAPANAPRILDMITPASTTQSDALAYDDSSLAELPFSSL